ncbi:MAG: hypothetical protein PHS59_09315 [Paludibacter sp.]|nr:hypothetical protein [Paludibacter sp.]
MSSNILSVGISYSANGGFSASAFGFSYSANGLQFDPSISASYTINGNIEVNRKSQTTSTTSTSVTNSMQVLTQAAKELTANMISEAEWPDFKTYDAGTLKTVESVAPAKVLKAEVISVDQRADLVRIPKQIYLEEGRTVDVTFNFIASDGRNGNQLVRNELLQTLKTALSNVKDIRSIDVSATTNGAHKDHRHPAGKAMDIDMFNGNSVRNMQKSQMIIDFQKALENTPYIHQNFGPKYHYLAGHHNHVHFSINL